MKKSLPGWEVEIEEVSNGVFCIKLIDSNNRKIEVVSDDYDAAMQTVIGEAFHL